MLKRVLNRVLNRQMAHEDTRIAVLVGWLVIVPVITLFSYYYGTVAVDEHVQDLQVHDMIAAIPYGLGGLLIGTALALWMTFVYPRTVFRDLAAEEHAHRHHGHGDHGHGSFADGDNEHGAHVPGGRPDIIPDTH